MTWNFVVAKAAQKQLQKLPVKDNERIAVAIRSTAADPFQGDVTKLEGGGNRYRRRVGSFRVLFQVDRATRTVEISAIVRRTSTTY
jgi:mRNA-degrading endonuclease RelE of RelBE toxin-antitoxin system